MLLFVELGINGGGRSTQKKYKVGKSPVAARRKTVEK